MDYRKVMFRSGLSIRKALLAVLVSLIGNVALAQFSADKTYVISNRNDANVYMQDNGTGGVASGSFNDNSYWIFESTGNTDCYYVKNAVTEKYMQSTKTSGETVATGTTPVEICVKLCTVEGENMYGFASTDQTTYDFTAGTIGANWDNTRVQGFAATAGTNHKSFWKVVEQAMPQPVDDPDNLISLNGTEIGAGDDIYLFNIDKNVWLQNNDWNTSYWTTRAEAGTRGIDVNLTISNGGWVMNPKFGNNHSINYSGYYLDTNEAVSVWTFTPTSRDGYENVYRINSSDTQLSVNDSKSLVANGSAQDWQLLTRAERLAQLAAATEPVDVSWLIKCPDFANADERFSAWTITTSMSGASYDRVGDQSPSYSCNRIFKMSKARGGSIMQTITGIPNGYYALSAQGAYSPSEFELGPTNRRNWETGNLPIGAHLYMNGKTIDMPCIYSESKLASESGFQKSVSGKDGEPTKYFPGGNNQISRDIFDGYYKTGTIMFNVTDGTLTIGVTCDNTELDGQGREWFVVDNFKLIYYGELTAALESAIAQAEAFDKSTTTTALATALQNAIDVGKGKLESTDADEIEAAAKAINDALAAATSIDLTLLRATITLAAADGADVTAANAAIETGTSMNDINNALTALRLTRRLANAETHENVFAGNVPAEGDFYLYNVGQKRFFCGGDDWGAHAALGFPGVKVTLIADGGSFKINTHLNNGGAAEYLGYNGYADANEQSLWNFVLVSDGVYNIARQENTSLLLGYTTGTYHRLDVDRTGGDNPDNQWKLVTKADRDALLATATEDAPQDASYLIKSPGFSQREDVSAWTMTGGAEIWGRGGNHPDFAIEAYNKTAAGVEQTVTGLPAGTYELKVQAFYRDGNFNTQAEILAGGGDARQLATLYAGTKSALIQNVSGGADKAPGMGRSSSVGYMPDGIDDACLYFQSGLYWASLDEIVVGQDGTMTIGARKTEKINDGDWMVLDNFRLIYKGAGVDLLGVKADLLAKIGEANNLMDALDLRLSFLKTLADNGQDVYDNSTDADEIVNATNALQTAINQVNNTTNLTAFIQTAAKATNEGVDANDAKAAVEAVTDGTTFASVVSAQLYNLTSARKVKALGKSDIYTGVAPVAGKYRLYNLGTGMFLGMGSDYNTHAAVDQVGIEVELVAEGDDFFLKTIYGDHWFNADPFVDTREGDRAIYSFAVVSGNVYTIKQGERLLGWNPNVQLGGVKHWNTIANTNDASADDANFQWKLVNEAEFEAILATAAADNAVDVSYKINNPSFNRLPNFDMWQKEVTGGNGGARVNTPLTDNNGDRAADYGYEFFNTDNFSYTQKVTGLKPGKYQVSVQAFYRDGDGAHQKQLLENDEPSAQAAYLYANGSQEYLPNVSSVRDLVPGIDMGRMMETTKGAFTNWPDASFEYFEHGAYWTTVEAKVGGNGELTLGVKKDTKPNGNDWVVLDNFRMAYLGTPLGINTMSIVGDLTGGWPEGDNWTMAKHMTMDDNDPNIWTLTIEDFYAEGRTYNYKAAANDSWDGYKLPDGMDNAEFVFGTEGYPAGNYRLVFTVNTSTHTMTLDVQKPTVTISENADNEVAAAEDALILLNRSFTNEGWNTFVVPFAISNADLKRAFGDEVKVAEYSEDSVDPQNVIVRFKKMEDGEDAVSANVPVLLQTNTTKTSFLFKSDIVEGTPKTEGTNYDFVGSYDAPTTIPDGEFFLSGNKIYKSKGATTLKGTRAYFKAKTAGARIVTLLFDNEGMTTAISENFKVKSEKPATIYDLQGRKLSTVKKGVYIMDGKKVVK